MARAFNGKIELGVRESEADWGAFTAPAGAPNVLVVLDDDTRCAAWSPYGGRIEMPTLQRLADAVDVLDRGLCISYDSGDAVSSEYRRHFHSAGGETIKVVFDVADDAYADVERHLAAAMMGD